VAHVLEGLKARRNAGKKEVDKQRSKGTQGRFATIYVKTQAKGKKGPENGEMVTKQGEEKYWSAQ